MPITPVRTVTVMPPPPPQPCMFHLDQYFDEAHLQFVCKELEAGGKAREEARRVTLPGTPALHQVRYQEAEAFSSKCWGDTQLSP